MMSKRSDGLKAKFGEDYFSKIGKRGGQARKEQPGLDYRVLGATGGKKTLEKFGREHFVRARFGQKSKPDDTDAPAG